MIKIDLITGFLGSGKTTFLKKYAAYLLDQGLHIGILENDYGAVNVDMILLQDIQGENCNLFMVAGGCDPDCHKRRFKTKLISMGMTGYDRVIIEPSGIFDMDEFFDVLHEEPLNQWYEIGNVMAIVEAGLESELSDMSAFYLASQIADAGQIIFSKVQEVGVEEIKHTISQLNESLEKVHCPRTISEDDLLIKDWSEITESDWKRILHCGYRQERYVKYVSDYSDYFATLYYLNEKINLSGLKSLFKKIIDNPDYGNVIRIKGFVQEEDQWYEINATKKKMEIRPIEKGQEVIIIIGEKLNKAKIDICVKEASSDSLHLYCQDNETQ